MRLSKTTLLAIALPLVCYLAGVALLGNWVMDDAGVFLACARCLHTQGHTDEVGVMLNTKLNPARKNLAWAESRSRESG